MNPTPNRLTPIRVLSLFLMVLPLATIGCSRNITDEDVPRMRVQEVARRLDRKGGEILVLDVRDAERYGAGHLPYARLTRLPDVREFELTPGFTGYDEIIVYGQNRGAGPPMALAKRLIVARHDDVYLMEEGFDAWKANGLPVESPPDAPASDPDTP